MDEAQVSAGSRYLFITPTLKGVLDDYSYANPNRSNRALERFARVVEVSQVRFYMKIDLLSGTGDQFGYAKAADGTDINFMVVEKSAVIKFDKHVASRVFSPDELESLDSYMMKYRKYGIVELSRWLCLSPRKEVAPVQGVADGCARKKARRDIPNLRHRR